MQFTSLGLRKGAQYSDYDMFINTPPNGSRGPFVGR